MKKQKPKSGPLFESKKDIKYALRTCQKSTEKNKEDALAAASAGQIS